MFFRRGKKVKRPLYRRIINAFIYFGVGLIVILLIAFAITQTSTFRNWLRETVIEQVNTTTNGDLYIERIDGTIFTSLILNNTTLTLEGETILNAGSIEVKTSPLKMLFKIIYFRKIEIKDATIALLTDENGELNISKLIPPSEDLEEEETSDFKWKLQVADLSLRNLNAKLQSYKHKHSRANYKVINLDDFRVNNINLSLSAFVDIKGNEFDITIHNFSANPNLYNFDLKDLSLKFLLIDDKAGLPYLNLLTGNSQISLSAGLSNYKLLGEDKGRKIEDALMRLDFTAADFNFDNLSSFIEATDLLKGYATIRLSANGSLNKLNIGKLFIEMQGTQLDGTGKLENITGGSSMNINTVFANSRINQEDVNNLLHTIDLPVYKDLGIISFDTLSFKGSPLNFTSYVKLKTDKGNINTKAKLNLEKEEFEYDISFTTSNFDVSPFTGVTTKLNSKGTFTGRGLTPEDISAKLNFNADGSVIDNNKFQNLKIDTEGKNGIITSNFSILSDSTNGSININLDLTDNNKPKYNFKASLSGFNIRVLAPESDMQSDLNFYLEGEGEQFDQDKLNLFTSLVMENSTIRGLQIDSTRAIVDIRNEQDRRVINVISDLADITLSGNFNIADLIDVLNYKSNMFSNAVNEKINDIQYPASSKIFNDYTSLTSLNPDIDLYYALEFKDFELLSLFLGNAEIEIDGELAGEIKTYPDSIYVSLNTNLDYFKFWDGNELIYLSQLDLEFLFSDILSATDLTSLITDIKLKARKIFLGSDFDNLMLNFEYKNHSAIVDFYVVIGELFKTKLNGELDIRGEKASFTMDKLFLSYNKYNLINKGKLDIVYSNQDITFNRFVLTHNNGELNLLGKFSLEGQHNLDLYLKNFESEDLIAELFGLPANESIKGIINLSAIVNGFAGSPKLDLAINIDSLAYKNETYGSFESSAYYNDKLLTTEVKFSNGDLQSDKSKLVFKSTIPIDFALTQGGDLLDDQSIIISLQAEEFELSPFASAVGELTQIKGKLNADLNATGTLQNLNTTGYFNVNYASFILGLNRLKYYAGFQLNFAGNRVDISNLYVSNSDDLIDGGTIKGNGYLVHKNFSPSEIEISVNGLLKLLSKTSRAANPTFYGDLAVETQEDMVYKFNRRQNYLSANLLLKKGANITYSPTSSAFTNETDKFVYQFKTAADSLYNKEIDSLIFISESVSKEIRASSRAPFDLDIKINVEDEVKMIFILSKEFNQDLTAYLGGNFEYVVENNNPIAKGELVLLDGSKLNFIKTFQAEGSVKFLSELDNPYLDVTATYQNYYNPDTLGASSSEYEVQVRINIEGPVKNLSTSFIENEDNVSVYKRDSRSGQFELDATKDASDAMFFIILGKFPEDATTQETNLVASTAASLAGSLLSSFLNERFGDIVRSVQVRQVGAETKFSLVGKVGDFRYEIGGSSQIFQDFSRANVKIEWPVVPITPLLILRLERREPVFVSRTYSEMINELGFKYSFEF